MKIPQFDHENEDYHLGNLFIDMMKSRPDAICQIDAYTGQSETNAEVLSRSIRFARCLRRFGLKPGDVVALAGRNHLDVHIVNYAALINGMPICGVDPMYGFEEIKAHFSMSEPKIIFCQKEFAVNYTKAVNALELDTKIVCFDGGDYTLKKFIEEYDDKEIDEEFKPAVFDLDKIYACFIASGGTTGTIKLMTFKHKTWVNKLIAVSTAFHMSKKRVSDDNVNALNVAQVGWVTGFLNTLAMPLLHMTKVQTSGPPSMDDLIDVINKYKPMSVVLTPIQINLILESEKDCDFTCFDSLLVAGTKLHKDCYEELRKKMRPDAVIIETYGQTENMGPVFMTVPFLPVGSCGNGKYSWHKLKLVDVNTGEEITKPNVPGELWTKGPRFSEYYKRPEMTASVFTDDGWYKTGDMLYRDENDNYYFVDRVGMLINGDERVSTIDIEEVIRSHPGVREVCVTKVRGVRVIAEEIVACVVKRAGSDVTAQEIEDLVASKLPDSHKLRGGVMFMAELPTTTSGKIAMAKLNHIVFMSRKS